jgi:phage minor structural protein
MECIFLNAAGTTLFVRDDMESGHWVQEQMNVTAEFPFDAGKVIQIGQRIAFRDPVTDTLEVFEIINVVNQEPEHFQQITAEHICIAELSDEHINKTEITDKTAAQALATALTGTLWSVGNNSASGTQSADINRGSVWNAICTIQQNWNVYITPRVTISSAGEITGKYLDISPTTGTWRGLRLSVRKNLVDPCVTYDDTEVYTALYGYGAMVDVTQASGDDTTEELTFASEVWSATDDHPAKPSGQKYLEWPEKTALYGRNGRPRFGYYQNSNIKTASLLLEKTWESLKKSCEPLISIVGTCADLYRLGYKDEPLRLHDLALVEIEETGETFYRQIICLDVDLIDPTGSRPEIGDYIPNIVYISRDTNEISTTGSSGGGGGGRGKGSMTNLEEEDRDYYTEFIKTNEQIGMVVRRKNGTDYVVAGNIALAINQSSLETGAFINADHVNISGTQSAHLLAGSIVYDADGNLVLKESSGGGIVIQRTESGVSTQYGVFDQGTLTAGVIATIVNGVASTYISGDKIYIGNESATTVINGKCALSDVTANYISGQLASLAQVSVNGLNVIGDCYVRNSGGQQQNVSAAIWDLNITQSGNTYTLQRKRIQDSAWVDVGTFSRATTLSGAWSGGALTVTASPQGNTFVADLFTAGHWGYAEGESTTTYYGSISAHHNGGSTSYSTGEYFTVDASSIYTAGANSVTLSQGSWSEGALTVTASNGETATVSIPATSSSSLEETSVNRWKGSVTLGGTTRYTDTETIFSHHSIGFTNKSGNVAYQFICEAACQYYTGSSWIDNPETYSGGDARSTRTFELYRDGDYVKVRQVGKTTSYAQIAAGGSVSTNGTLTPSSRTSAGGGYYNYTCSLYTNRYLATGTAKSIYIP